MTPEFGAATQLEKIEMLDAAHFIVLNKFEKPRSEDALRDIRKQYRRNHQEFAGQGVSPELRPGYLVGIRVARSVTQSQEYGSYSGPIGFINLSWSLASAVLRG
jgi:hypothetical protein